MSTEEIFAKARKGGDGDGDGILNESAKKGNGRRGDAAFNRKMKQRKGERTNAYVGSGIVAGLSGAELGLGEAAARGHDKQAGYWDRRAAQAGGGDAAKTAKERAWHTEQADLKEKWATRRGPQYPYMNGNINQRAAQEAREHRVKAGQGGASDWASKIEASGAKRNARMYRAAASDTRIATRVGGGAGLALAGVLTGASLYQGKKDAKAIAARYGSKEKVGKSMDVNELFDEARGDAIAKFERETKSGAKWGAGISGTMGAASGAMVGGAVGGGKGALAGAVSQGALSAAGGAVGGAAIGGGIARDRQRKKGGFKPVKKNVDVAVFDEAREAFEKAFYDGAIRAAGSLGSKTKNVGAGAFNAAKPKVAAATNSTIGGAKKLGAKAQTQWAGQSQARKYVAVGAGGAAGGIGLGAMAQSNKPKQPGSF